MGYEYVSNMTENYNFNPCPNATTGDLVAYTNYIPGTYVFYLIPDDMALNVAISEGRVLATKEITVVGKEDTDPPEGPVIITDKDEYAFGDPIYVQAFSDNANGTDWIGIVPKGIDTVGTLVWDYLTMMGEDYDITKSQNLNGGPVMAPYVNFPAGKYVIYLVPNDRNLLEAMQAGVILATKEITIVGEGGIASDMDAMTTDKEVYKVGEPILINANSENKSGADWVGITVKGFESMGVIEWDYLSNITADYDITKCTNSTPAACLTPFVNYPAGEYVVLFIAEGRGVSDAMAGGYVISMREIKIVNDPDVATEDMDFDHYLTKNYMPADILEGIKALYEGKGANTGDWYPASGPYTVVNEHFWNTFSGTRLRSITLPVNSVSAADAEGNALFTISTYKKSDIENSSPVRTWQILVNLEEHGLRVGYGIFKFVKIDLSSYDIRVGNDEVLAFSSLNDTIFPAFGGDAITYFQENFPEMMVHGGCVGKVGYLTEVYTNSCLFFDIEYDIPVFEEFLKLRDLIEEVETYEAVDYASGWDTFAAILEAAKTILVDKHDSPEDLGGIYTELEKAAAELVPVATVDKSVLNTAIEEANKLDGKDAEYTPATWDAFTAALAAAKEVLAMENPQQSQINNAAKALTDAQAALQKKPSLDALAKALADAAALVEADYVAATWQAFVTVFDAAKAVYDNVNATAEEVEAAVASLKAAVEALDKKVDTTELQAKVNNVRTDVDKNKYTSNSYKRVTDALDDAVEAIEAGDLGEKGIAALIKAIDDAVSKLEERANIEELQALYDQWKDVDDSDYHPDGLAALTAALDGISYACKPNMSSTISVEDANELKAALQAAIDALKKYADYTAVDAKLAEVEKLNKDEYTEESWKAVEAVKTAIEALKADRMSTEEDAAKALEDLNAAVGALVKKAAEQTTDAPKATEDPKTTEKPKDTGCGSTVVASVVAIVAVLGCAVVLKKKD
jgi:hypothetical protein